MDQHKLTHGVLTRGVLTGCNQTQEWMLPWWVACFKTSNPICSVTFADFGLSKEARAWCEKRGNVLSFSEENESFQIVPFEKIPREKAAQYEEILGREKLEAVRPPWFKKLFAFSKTPYQQTVWLDVDTQVLKPIDFLFSTCQNPAGVSIALDLNQWPKILKKFYLPGEKSYNTGVVVFERNSSVIQESMQIARFQNEDFFTDQEVLSRVLFSQKKEFYLLPMIFNWSILSPIPAFALKEIYILHYQSDFGKNLVKNQLELMRKEKNLFLEDWIY